jgi:mono/diheme cytochrome c family protein
MPVLALSVDVAASSDGAWLAVAHAGGSTDKVTIFQSTDLPTLGRSPVRCADDAGRVIVDGQPIAVAIHPGRTPGAVTDYDWLIVQTRAPAQLGFYRGFTAPRTTIPLGGPTMRDAGHDLFHLDTRGGIACAQCHPEGAEDGRVWKFSPLGDRRTQAVHVGLEGTEPFHWSGNLPNLQDLVDEVFVHRMGGSPPSSSELERLKHWLFALRPPAPIVDSETPAAVRGRALFESPEVGCTTCHAGTAVAKSESEDVGVESPLKFQIPSLRGVGYRAPFLHDGCATTLRERFDPSCGGGDRHGTTSQLSSADIDDLIAHLQSL